MEILGWLSKFTKFEIGARRDRQCSEQEYSFTQTQKVGRLELAFMLYKPSGKYTTRNPVQRKIHLRIISYEMKTVRTLLAQEAILGMNIKSEWIEHKHL